MLYLTKWKRTITVVVEAKRNHPVYGRRINYSKNTKHDETNVAKEGDIVHHGNSRPLFSYKRYRLVEVVEESGHHLIKPERRLK